MYISLTDRLQFRIHRALTYIEAVRRSSSVSENPADVLVRILTAKPDVGDGMDEHPLAQADVKENNG